jgi:tetratricopeptide (TPR) repeat protein
MMRSLLAAVLINRAADKVEFEDDPERAMALTRRALRLIAADGDTMLARGHAGRAHHVQALALVKLGRLDEAIGAYARAEAKLQADPQLKELHVRCLHDAVVTFGNLGLEELALSYASKGKAAAVGLVGSYEPDFESLALELEPYDRDTYKQHVDRLGIALARTNDPARARVFGHALAKAICEFGDAAEVRAVFELITRVYHSSTDLEMRVTALTPLAYLQRELQPVPDELVAASVDVVAQLTPRTETTIQAQAQLVHAVASWSRGRLEEAVEAALRAVALYNAGAWHVGSSVVRWMTGDERHSAWHVALRLACELNDGPLAAELIESARLPALPERSPAAATVTFLHAEATYDVVHRKLGPLHPLHVEGRSRIAPHYPATVRLGHPIDLEAVIERVGGREAWWWAAWLGPGARHWVIRSPEGVFSCGYDDDETGHGLLLSALRMTPTLGTASACAGGAFTASYAAEERASAELGDLLVPAPLRVALAGSAQPLSLVVASNYLSTLPLPLLGIGTEAGRRPTRLVERAILRLAPPAAVVDQVDAAPASSPPYPLGVVCTDPVDELTFATLPFEDARYVLGSHKLCAEVPHARPANVENLVQALRAVEGRRSVLAYSGHADEGTFGPDLESALPLIDGRLTAEALFTGNRTDGATIPFPERVLLGACGSAGSTGTGSGEWIGLTAGALCSGAREVIATAWPIWDLPVTRDLDAELMQVLQDHPDVAAGLRDAQLRCLTRWRAATCDYADRGPSGDAREALPLVWAAYQCLGVPHPAP